MKKLLFSSIACATFLALLALGLRVQAVGDDSQSWINQTPQVQKLVELGDGKRPALSNMDCSPGIYQSPTVFADELPICTNTTPLGALANGTLYLGPSERVGLKGPGINEAFYATPGRAMLLRRPSVQNGFLLGVYHNPSIAFAEKVNDYIDPYYRYKAEPDQMLTDPATGELMRYNPGAISFSANGQWMVLDSPGRGLARVNLDTFAVTLFARSLESYDFYGLSNAQLAISNDGSVVASSLLSGNGGGRYSNLTLYDLNDCKPSDQIGESGLQICANKDIWQGNVSERINSTDKPVRLRFLNNNALSFDTIYDQQSDVTFKTARFVVSVNGTPGHKMGLLGMGDSYISGEGTFDYRLGTDTANNTCHQSELSYPFQLGKNYTSYSSIACSGAVSNDIKDDKDTYKGQVKDKVAQKDRQNKAQILSQYLPGYLNQLQFVQTYTPEVAIVSIGGNDIGFSDIIKSCVANTGGGTCYGTYEDRLELMRNISSQFYNLRSTYLSIKNASPGVRVYVVGYPQIVKPDGDCGLNVHLNTAETEFSNQLISYIDKTVQQAANSAGVVYVDTQHSFDGYRLCETQNPYSAVNGLTAGKDGGPVVFGKELKVIGSESYHPTKLGHFLLANTVSKQTHDETLAMPPENPDIRPVAVNGSDPLLTSVPRTNRQTQRTLYDQSLSSDILAAGQPQTLQFNPETSQLAPLTPYTVELHSEPVQLATGTANQTGTVELDVRIPASIPAGYHTLHLYGTDLAGQPVDIQKRVYVITGPADILACGIVAVSGQDTDNDGIDDSCDGSIGPAETGSAQNSHMNIESNTKPDAASESALTANIQLIGGLQGSADRQLIQSNDRTGQVLGAATVMPQDGSITEVATSASPPHTKLHYVHKTDIIIFITALAGFAFLTLAVQFILKRFR